MEVFSNDVYVQANLEDQFTMVSIRYFLWALRMAVLDLWLK